MEPQLNDESPPKMRKKKSIKVLKERNHNVLLGEGKSGVDERYIIARKRRLRTIEDYEKNKSWWGRETSSIVENIKKEVNYNEYIDGKVEEEYFDPRLARKLYLMEEGKRKLSKNKENCPLQGGPVKKHRYIKKMGRDTLMAKDSDILLLGKDIGRKEKPVRDMRRRASENAYNIPNKNGFLDCYKEYHKEKILPPRGKNNNGKRTPNRVRKTKKVNPVRNMSYNMMGCLIDPQRRSYSRGRYSTVSESGNRSCSRTNYEKGVMSSSIQLG